MEDAQDQHPYVEILLRNLSTPPNLVGASLEFELSDCYLQLKLLGSSEPGRYAATLTKLTLLKSSYFERYRSKSGYDYKELAYDIRGVSEQGIDLWLRTLRWKSGDVLIGKTVFYRRTIKDNVDVHIPPVDGEPERTFGKTFITSTDTPQVLNRDIWDETAQSLKDGVEPPLSFDLFADAIYLGVSEDYRRAYLELAMAAEVHVRTRIEAELPNGVSQSLREEIRLMDYSKLLKVFFKQLSKEKREALTGEGGIKSKLQKLLEDRNIIVHQGGHTGSTAIGKGVDLSREKFSTYRDAVERLLKH